MSPECSPQDPAGDLTDRKIVEVELNNNDIPGMSEVKTILSPAEEEKCEEVKVLTENQESGVNNICDSCGSDDSEDKRDDTVKRQAEEESHLEDEHQVKDRLARQFRSMSEGAAVFHHVSTDGDVMVFPNLRDNALEALGLLPNGQPKERLSEEEIEQKFQTLTLAFAIDAVTLADRLERQQRQRDQAEENLATEVTKFVHAVHRLNPLCVDAETTELVTGLLGHLELMVQASRRISTSAEVFGSVQQEWRIADSVNLMLSHLRNLRQQRDTARRQVQCTKRMLQDSTNPVEPLAGGSGSVATRQRLNATSNGRVVTRRRASIATIPRPLESPSVGSPAGIAAAGRRVAPRRVSAGVCGEHSPRLWDCRPRPDWMERGAVARSSRPSRLDFGVDLSKIQEGIVESSLSQSEDPFESDSEELEFKTPTDFFEKPLVKETKKFALQQHTTMKKLLRHILGYIGAILSEIWNRWVENGTLHELCCVGTCFCFAMATVILCNLMVEVEIYRGGMTVQRVPWKWITWDEFWSFFYERDSKGRHPI